MTAVEVVQKQLGFYNNHDLEGFASTYSRDIKIYNLGEVTPFLSGIETLRERYAKKFKTPGLHANISNRITLGNYVIDHENVTVLQGDEEVKSSVIAMYEVKDDLIINVWFARE